MHTMETDTGQVVKMRERGAQTVRGCEQAQCSRRGSDIREMEIYGRWRYNNLIYAEALAYLPGPQPAELHHYHHDDVVRTSAAPWPLPLACLLPRRMERNACKPGRWLARLWGALKPHSHPLKTQPHLRLNELKHTAEIVCAAQWRHVAPSEDDCMLGLGK